MDETRGSSWRKWDLHVHTPDSLVHHYGGAEAWEKFIVALSNLPPEFKVLGINDYIFLDGYKKVVAARDAGKLPNIELVVPVLEFRLDKFGGSQTGLRRVNFHVIFSDAVTTDTIESQFLSALCPKYILTPEIDSLRQAGKWSGVPTRQSLEDLGRAIIGSVPGHERVNYASPLLEGFNNLCLSLDAVKDILASPYFDGNVLTAVGKTEWADIKWNDQSIADKKTIINGANLVFISSATLEEWGKARKSLTEGGVNDRLLDCSDAHRYADSTDKDRLGKCLSWIKADSTFEGLRQTVFEYRSRVHVCAAPPIEPLLQIKKVTLRFPEDTKLSRGERSDVFCFRGTREVSFSPYLTCIIGGRGTGKSTLLNLINEKLKPGSTAFFKQNRLLPIGTSIDAAVTIDGVSEQGVIEFLQQNEIEQFAADHKRLTEAIVLRLRKLDTKGVLVRNERSISLETAITETHLERVRKHHEVSVRLLNAEKELKTQVELMESIQSEDYRALNAKLAALNKELVTLRNDRSRLTNLREELRAFMSKHLAPKTRALNAYEEHVDKIIQAIEQALLASEVSDEVTQAANREQKLSDEVGIYKAALEEDLQQRGLSTENLADLGLATERVAQLREEIVRLDATRAHLKTDLESFVSRREVAQSYMSAVEGMLAPINDELKGQGAEVKPIELRYEFDFPAFNRAMIQHVTNSMGQIEARAARVDYVENKLQNIDFRALGDQEQFIRNIPDDSTVYAKTLREFFAQGVNYEVLKIGSELLLLDVGRFGQIHVLYDGKPIENSSFGQRCTAVIVVLLLLGNTPIVIDEPEAHLDSSLIAKYLVNLVKTRKPHRQIIFATHNANIVINGDAELILCMSMDENNATKIVATTIEDLAHRDLLLALEGGEKAFHQRERRYGID